MKETPNQGRFARALQAFHDRHGKLVGAAANGFGIATGAAWLVGMLPTVGSWNWPAVAGLGLVALALALYRSHELSRSLSEHKEAFNALCDVTGAVQIKAFKSFFADAEASGYLPVTHLAACLATLKSFSKTPEDLDDVIELLADYERARTEELREE